MEQYAGRAIDSLYPERNLGIAAWMGAGVDMCLPEYPFDTEELKHIQTLIDKIPLYRRKVATLAREVAELGRSVSDLGPLWDVHQAGKLIFKAFFSELENRPFSTRDAERMRRISAEIVWDDTITNRNIPCEICGDNRSIDRCHIVPNSLGGLGADDNIVYLCPTHHRLLDRHALTRQEWVQIDWGRKSKPSQHYARTVTLRAQKEFWAKACPYEVIGQYGVDEGPYVEYVARQIGDLFIAGKTVNRASVYSMLDRHMRTLAKKVVPALVDSELLLQTKLGSRNMLLLPGKEFRPTRKALREIAQRLL